jgi:Fur family ferric uptake transcriptional regulator
MIFILMCGGGFLGLYNQTAAGRADLPVRTAGGADLRLRAGGGFAAFAGNPVGIATIYRQLEKLEQAGHIHKVITEEGAFYQYCDHASADRECFLLRCEGCGRILHLDCSHLRPLYDHLEQEHHFLINTRETMFTGLCDVCAAKRKEDSIHGTK